MTTEEKQPDQRKQPDLIDEAPLPSALTDALESYASALHTEGTDEAFMQQLERQLQEIPHQAAPQLPLWRRPLWQWSGYLAAAATAAMVLFVLPPSMLRHFGSTSTTPQRDGAPALPGPGPRRTASQRQPAPTRSTATPRRPQPRRQAMIPKGLSLQLFAISQKTRYKQKILIRDGETLYSGDQIQFVYATPAVDGPGLTIAIISLNQRGEAAVFVPHQGDQSLRLPRQQGTFPPLELDDYVGLERIFVLTSTRPFSLMAARRALRKAYKQAEGKLQAPFPVEGPWQVTWSLLLRKRKALPRP